MARNARRRKQEAIELLRCYRNVLQREGIPVHAMILFGSVAKGTYHRWSDIDVAVVSRRFGRDSHAERVRLMQLGDGISPRIEPHPFHPNDLKDRWSTIAAEIRAHGIVIR